MLRGEHSPSRLQTPALLQAGCVTSGKAATSLAISVSRKEHPLFEPVGTKKDCPAKLSVHHA